MQALAANGPRSEGKGDRHSEELFQWLYGLLAFTRNSTRKGVTDTSKHLEALDYFASTRLESAATGR